MRPFIGRARELAILERGLAEAAGGRGRLYLVVGEPGIGKTRLAQEIAAAARGRGAQVLWGTAAPESGAPAFWPWLEALRASLGDVAHELERIITAASRHHVPGFADVDEERFLFFDRTMQLLRDAARTRLHVIVLDDLHEADPASLSQTAVQANV